MKNPKINVSIPSQGISNKIIRIYQYFIYPNLFFPQWLHISGLIKLMSVEARFIKEAEDCGKRITFLRKVTGMNQELIAIPVGLTQSQWSLVERGKANFTFYNLMKIAYALEVNSSVLFDYSGELRFRKKNQTISVDERFEIEKNKFGSRILELIQYRKIKQDDFSVKAEIDSGDLSHFINGEHNIELFNIVKIAEGLKVRLIDLFLYKGPFPK